MFGPSGSQPLPFGEAQKSPSLVRHPFLLHGSEAFLGTLDEDRIYMKNIFGHLNDKHMFLKNHDITPAMFLLFFIVVKYI